jgi:cyanophycin synthetase
MNILLTPLRQLLLYNGLSRGLKRRGWDEKSARFFLRVSENLKIVRRRQSIADCKVRRAQVLWEEAEKRGIKMEELLLFGKAFDVYTAEKSENRRIGKSEHGIIFSGLPRPKGYSNNWLDLMDDKWLLKKKLKGNNLPVPAGKSVSRFSEALKVFNSISKPAIVKPRGGSRGRHTTTFVSTEAELHQAFKIAKQLCYWVMVEEQLTGPVYRATLVNFELAGVLRGDSPQIIGDGINTISQLISQKNLAPHDGVKNIAADDRAKIFLSRQGLGLTSIPKKGQLVYLSEKIGVSYGGSSSEDLEICHPDNKELFIKAAKVLGDPIVGFDFIIPDIATSYKQQKCGFIEVNSLPFINLHHDPLHGKAQNVAARVWDMVGM